jgi:hypothetical protein
MQNSDNKNNKTIESEDRDDSLIKINEINLSKINNFKI